MTLRFAASGLMNSLATFDVALDSLRRTPVRSALTALGIIIGVAAVVTTVSIGSGAKARIEEALSRPESQQFYVGAVAPLRTTSSNPPLLSQRDKLNASDYYGLRREVAGIQAATPRIYMSSVRSQSNGRRIEAVIDGVDVDGLDLLLRRVIVGTGFGSVDIRQASGVCVITWSLAHELFPNMSAVSRTIRFNDVPFIVIGVVADDQSLSTPLLQSGKDLHTFVPFSTLLRRLDRNADMSLIIRAPRPENLEALQQSVSNYLEEHRGRRRVVFRVNNTLQAVQAYAEGSKTIARLLAAVACVALIVGGVGIMNVMLVNVTERTREIGIRMALGTRPRDILRQFLAEASALSIVGGLVGIALGATVASLITHLNQWPTRITLDSVVSAFLCSAAVGVAFGYYPARSASRLDPIDCLRTE